MCFPASCRWSQTCGLAEWSKQTRIQLGGPDDYSLPGNALGPISDAQLQIGWIDSGRDRVLAESNGSHRHKGGTVIVLATAGFVGYASWLGPISIISGRVALAPREVFVGKKQSSTLLSSQASMLVSCFEPMSAVTCQDGIEDLAGGGIVALYDQGLLIRRYQRDNGKHITHWHQGSQMIGRHIKSGAS